MRNLGDRIAEFREKKGMSRYRLAKESEVSYSYISVLEKNKHNPSVEIIERLASCLGVSVNVLISGKSEGE